MFFKTNKAGKTSKTAYIFPGQGSQYVGMGWELFKESPAARKVFREVDQVLGQRLTRVFFFGPTDILSKTVNCQPAIMAVSLAALKATEEQLGENSLPRPTMMAGHSLGEYTALVVAGALDLPDAVRLVRLRGQLMQEASERVPGGMAAVIGLDEVTMEEVCQETGTEISTVNSDSQIVISGTRMALARALDLASMRGAKRTIPLSVSGAFHSSLMQPVIDDMAKALDKVPMNEPSVPVVANCTGALVTSTDQIKTELLQQVCSCVHWKKSVNFMVDSGVSSFIELGPGNVLSGLVKRMRKNANVFPVGDMASIQSFSPAGKAL